MIVNVVFCLPDEDPMTVAEITRDLDAAINQHGLLGGNFLVYTEEDMTQAEAVFWAEWNRRHHA